MTTLLMLSVFPAIAVLTPIYLIERQLGLLNSYPGLIIPYVAFNLPFAIWIMRNYLAGIPATFEEASEIDGASPLRRCSRSSSRCRSRACSRSASSRSPPRGASSSWRSPSTARRRSARSRWASRSSARSSPCRTARSSRPRSRRPCRS
ncbi:hypothetical protein [Frigoribacterium sp. PvP032]|uniref:hypothetical protein n=1 Tax=Frigoribacterium sp. PvP032 TaxID=2806589 RepID=UPI0035A86889